MFIFCVNGFLEKKAKMKKNGDHFFEKLNLKIFHFLILKKINSQTFSDLLSTFFCIDKKK
jgi:hypothetical protein